MERATATQVLEFYKGAPLELVELVHRLGSEALTGRVTSSTPGKGKSNSQSKKMKEIWAKRRAAKAEAAGTAAIPAANQPTSAQVNRPPQAAEYEQDEVEVNG